MQVRSITVYEWHIITTVSGHRMFRFRGRGDIILDYRVQSVAPAA